MNSYPLARACFLAFTLSILLPYAATAAGVILPSLAPVIKGASPGVVNIATRGTLTERVAGNPSILPRVGPCGAVSSRAPARA